MRALIISKGFPEEKINYITQSLQKSGFGIEKASENDKKSSISYDLIVFAGDEKILDFDIDFIKSVVENAFENSKIVAAIDYAPLIVATTGLLNERCATAKDKKTGEQMHSLGVIYIDKEVVTDENLITSGSHDSTTEFIEEILKQFRHTDNPS